MTLTVRHAISEDEGQIVALWKTCNLVTSYNDPVQDFRFARGKATSDILVGCTADGQVVGSVLVGHDGHRGWVWYVAADPQYRKQGIGKKMMRAAEEWLQARHIVKLMLLVRDTNTEVVDFYRHIGFESVPRVVMEKWLRD